MQRDDQDDLSDAFIEWYEAENAIEEQAQSLVAAVRTLVKHRVRYEPVDASDFPQRDKGYDDSIKDELTALGVETLGDFEDAAFIVTDPSQKSFMRFALGAHGAIAAMWFEVNAAELLRCLVLHSWLDDGRAVVTARGARETGLPMHPDILAEQVGAELKTRAAVRAHAERVAATGRAPRRVAGLSELFAGFSRDEQKLAQFREALGVAPVRADAPGDARRGIRGAGRADSRRDPAASRVDALRQLDVRRRRVRGSGRPAGPALRDVSPARSAASHHLVRAHTAPASASPW